MSNVDIFDGIVMYQRSYRENDVLVKILTKQAGKRMFFLKNAKRPNYQLTSETIPFTLATYEGKLNLTGLSFLNTAKKVTHFRHLNDDVQINAYATYMLGLIDAAFEDRINIETWFDEISLALNKLNNGFDPQVISQIVALKLLPDFGITLQLDNCVFCNKRTKIMDYSDKMGGLLCQNHFELDDHRLKLAPKTVYYLVLFSHLKLASVQSIKLSMDIKSELQKVIDLIYDNSVGVKLRARSFIEQLDTWQTALIKSRNDKKS